MRLTQSTFSPAMSLMGLFFPLAGFADVGTAFHQENGPLENAQVVLLFLAGILFLGPVPKSELSARCCLLGGALLCLSFILRELELEDLAVPQWLVLMGSGAGRNVVLAACWIVLGVFALRLLPEFKGILKARILWRTFMLLAISALLLLSSVPFDSASVETRHAQLYEEILETIAYGVLLCATIPLRAFVKKVAVKKVPPASSSGNGPAVSWEA